MAFHYVVLRDGRGDPWIEALREWPVLDAVVRNGYLGVDLFFLLSGFLLVLPWLRAARRSQPPPPALPFYVRRIRRIVPAYYVHLALLFAFFAPLVRGFDYLRADILVVALNIATHGAFLHGTTPLTSSALGVNGALWTLAIEAQFYLLLPLLAPAFARAPIRMTVASVGVAAAWQWGARHGMQPIVDLFLAAGAHWAWPESVVRHLLLTQLPSYAAHFALGALMARGWLRVSERDFRHAAVASAAVATAAAVAIVVLLRFIVAPWGEHSWMLTTAALAALLAAAATGARWAVRLLGRGPLAFVGRISYSIYLYHLPVLLLWNLHGPTGLLSAPLYGIAIIAIGWLSWRFVEAPFRSAGLRGARARPDEERRPDGEALQQGHAP